MSRPDNVCEHGNLRRKCPYCESLKDDETIESLTNALARSRNATLEEAAKLCEEMAESSGRHDGRGADACADAIRALKRE